MKKILFLTVFDPNFERNLKHSDISITSYNFFKIIFQGFFTNNRNSDFITTHHHYNGILKKSSFIKIFSLIQKLNFHDYDKIIVDSTIFSFLIIGFFLQFSLKFKVILILTDLPILNKLNIFKYLFQNLLINFFLNKVYLTNNMKKKYLNFKTLVIPFILPIECVVNNPVHQIPSKKYLYYAGSLDEINNIDKMISIFLNLNDKKLFLLIAGSGSNLDKLKNKFNFSNVVFLGQIEPEYSRKLMRNALLLLSFRDNLSRITKYSFPFKLMDYINSMTPIFTSKIDSFDSIPYITSYFYSFATSSSDKKITMSLNNVITNRGYFLRKSYSLYKKLFFKFNAQKIVNDIIKL
jgi:hypothetical protein